MEAVAAATAEAVVSGANPAGRNLDKQTKEKTGHCPGLFFKTAARLMIRENPTNQCHPWSIHYKTDYVEIQ